MKRRSCVCEKKSFRLKRTGYKMRTSRFYSPTKRRIEISAQREANMRLQKDIEFARESQDEPMKNSEKSPMSVSKF